MSVAWDDQRIFLHVLEAGSLSGAARELGLSHPTVRARILALEHALGVTLFTRSPAGLSPTDLARSLEDPVRKMAAQSDLFLRRAVATPTTVSGTVRLSVSEIVGVEIMPAMLADLRTKHPDLSVELVLTDEQSDVLEHEVDVALRSVMPHQKALKVRKIGRMPVGLFATKDYLARRGRPLSVQDLLNHDLIGPDRHRGDIAIATQIHPDLPKRFVMRTDSHLAQLAAGRAGIGIVSCQTRIGATDTGLVRVLPDFIVVELDNWLVFHEDLASSPSIRAIVDHLALAFSI